MISLLNKLLVLVLILVASTQGVQSQEIIPCRCTTDLFSGRAGYINQYDEIVAPLDHAGALDPFYGYGRVTNKYEWGLVDSTGALAVPVEFRDVGPIVNGDVTRVSNQNSFDKVPNHWALYSISKQDTITGYDYQDISIQGKGDLFVYSKIVDGNRVRGILNKEGKEIYQTKKGGHIYANKPHSSGIFIHELNRQQTFIDSTGRVLFPDLPRGKCSNFYDGYAFICNSKGCFKIDTLGELTELNFDEIVRDSPNGKFTVVKKDGLHGLFRYTGEEIVTPTYDGVFCYNDFFCGDEGSFIAKRNEHYVLIDSTGREVSEEYDRIFYAKHGYFTVVKNEKHGMLDRSGKIILEVKYEGICSTIGVGACAVKLNDKWGFIDFENNVLLPMEYHSIEARGNYIKYQRAYYGPPMKYAYVYKTKYGEISLRKLNKHNSKPCVFE